MNKKKKVLYCGCGITIGVIITIFILSIYMAFTTPALDKPFKSDIIYINQQDSTIEFFKRDIRQMKEDIERLKRKKSRLIINCCPKDTIR